MTTTMGNGAPGLIMREWVQPSGMQRVIMCISGQMGGSFNNHQQATKMGMTL